MPYNSGSIINGYRFDEFTITADYIEPESPGSEYFYFQSFMFRGSAQAVYKSN